LRTDTTYPTRLESSSIKLHIYQVVLLQMK